MGWGGVGVGWGGVGRAGVSLLGQGGKENIKLSSFPSPCPAKPETPKVSGVL